MMLPCPTYSTIFTRIDALHRIFAAAAFIKPTYIAVRRMALQQGLHPSPSTKSPLQQGLHPFPRTKSDMQQGLHPFPKTKSGMQQGLHPSPSTKSPLQQGLQPFPKAKSGLQQGLQPSPRAKLYGRNIPAILNYLTCSIHNLIN
jgi:hypothetical protein